MGRVDVDAMLAEMTPLQLVEWRAAIDRLALDDGWQQAGTICETIHNKITEVQAGMAGKDKIPKGWLAKAIEFIPLLRQKQDAAQSGGVQTPEQFLQSLGAFGHKVK